MPIEKRLGDSAEICRVRDRGDPRGALSALKFREQDTSGVLDPLDVCCAVEQPGLERGVPRAARVLDRGQIDEAVAARLLRSGNQGDPIPAEKIAHPFDPFHRERAPSAGTDGLRPGLYITDQIVRAHRGRLG